MVSGCYSRKDFSSVAFTASLVTHCEVPWKLLFPPESFLQGLCLALSCQIAAPSRGLVTSQAEAACWWWQDFKSYQQTEREWVDGSSPEETTSVLVSVRMDPCHEAKKLQFVAAHASSLAPFLIKYRRLFCCICHQQWWRIWWSPGAADTLCFILTEWEECVFLLFCLYILPHKGSEEW